MTVSSPETMAAEHSARRRPCIMRPQKPDREAAASPPEQPRQALDTRRRRVSRNTAAATALTVGPRVPGVATSHGFQKPSVAVQMESAPQRLWCLIGNLAGRARATNTHSSRDGVSGVRKGGCSWCRLGASTGRRCLRLKMGSKQSAQSAGTARM
ncbi:hypothetical protein BKA66DRAFT_441906 [Pyrenochaeta sp. MPI-SDFR-AT-0127]|nr:hypothetical protein BKA66DRAFT_441906 [Pyrenochaeta sp. MPI-SDFR-AT-0127]